MESVYELVHSKFSHQQIVLLQKMTHTCGELSELRSCDYCRRLYHIDCHVPPMSPNDSEFKCSVCEAEGKSRRVACGKCSGCKREEDCMTCISCVAKYEKGDTKRSKCIFRKCQSWGKATLIRANTDDTANDDDDEEDYHDADCRKWGAIFVVSLFIIMYKNFHSLLP